MTNQNNNVDTINPFLRSQCNSTHFDEAIDSATNTTKEERRKMLNERLNLHQYQPIPTFFQKMLVKRI